MSKTAQRTDPKLWEKVKSEVTRGRKGGEAGQWSARKAQLAVQEYKKRGGGYLGKEPDHNSRKQWADEDWGTKSGRSPRETSERSLPKKTRKALSDENDRKTTGKKRKPSSRPEGATKKTARSADKAAPKRPQQNKDELLKQARYLDIEGRSNMLKGELEDAVRLAKH